MMPYIFLDLAQNITKNHSLIHKLYVHF